MAKITIRVADDWMRIEANAEVVYEGHSRLLPYDLEGLLWVLGHETELFYSEEED